MTETANGAELNGHEGCPRCGGPMVETHCRTVCVNCGYSKDCNDQW